MAEEKIKEEKPKYTKKVKSYTIYKVMDIKTGLFWNGDPSGLYMDENGTSWKSLEACKEKVFSFCMNDESRKWPFDWHVVEFEVVESEKKTDFYTPLYISFSSEIMKRLRKIHPKMDEFYKRLYEKGRNKIDYILCFEKELDKQQIKDLKIILKQENVSDDDYDIWKNFISIRDVGIGVKILEEMTPKVAVDLQDLRNVVKNECPSYMQLKMK